LMGAMPMNGFCSPPAIISHITMAKLRAQGIQTGSVSRGNGASSYECTRVPPVVGLEGIPQVFVQQHLRGNPAKEKKHRLSSLKPTGLSAKLAVHVPSCCTALSECSVGIEHLADAEIGHLDSPVIVHQEVVGLQERIQSVQLLVGACGCKRPLP